MLRQLLPWNLAFGFAAGGVSTLYDTGGPLGLLVLLVPVAMLQLSLVGTTRRMHAEAEKDAAHAREREALLQRAANASERERRQLAADLHDGVIQDVTALTMRLGAAANRTGDEDPRLHDLLLSLSDIGNRITRDLRSTMIELAPPELEKHGIRASLQQLLGKLERDGIVGHLDCPEIDLDPQRLRLVHRVVQEAMRNAIKHSRCQNFWVTVRLDGDTVMATMRDDGRGFSEEERAQRRLEDHNGLGLLEQTVIDGGGRLSITSEPGVGTTMALTAAPAGDPLADAAPVARRDGGEASHPPAREMPSQPAEGPPRAHAKHGADRMHPSIAPGPSPLPDAHLQAEPKLEPELQGL